MAEPMTEKTESKARESVRRIDQSLPEQGREGSVTRKVEQQTSRIPSMTFLGLAVASMAASAGYEFFGDRKNRWNPSGKSNLGTFIGLWAPTFLLLGIYNKIVKIEGSERHEGSFGSSNAGGGARSYY